MSEHLAKTGSEILVADIVIFDAVLHERMLPAESTGADGTHERLFARVSPDVLDHMTPVILAFPANIAVKCPPILRGGKVGRTADRHGIGCRLLPDLGDGQQPDDLGGGQRSSAGLTWLVNSDDSSGSIAVSTCLEENEATTFYQSDHTRTQIQQTDLESEKKRSILATRGPRTYIFGRK